MAQTLTFVPWFRSGMYDLATGPTSAGGRLRAAVTLTATVRGTTTQRAGVAEFEIAGPGDVAGLRAGFVRRMVPPPRTTDAATTLMVHAELSEPDLPWRHTPQQAAGRMLRPWIVLVVGTEEEITLGADGTAVLKSDVLDAHDLSTSARWAHLQVEIDQPVDDAALNAMSIAELRELVDRHGGPPVARLLSPRPLAANSSCIAAIVPAFAADGSPRWGESTNSLVVPVHHHWTFRTGDAGDFRTLCAALRAERDPGDLGAADITIGLVDPPVDAEVRGAITAVDSADPALPAAVTAATEALLLPGVDERGRPIVGAPVYGAEWHPDASGTDWGGQANHDPRHRGSGGIGLAAGILLQDTIVDAVVEQVGSLDIANQRLAQLSTGLAASGSLWERRLPADPHRQIALFWATTARMVTETGPVVDRITAADRPLPRSLFSSAGRRILRTGPARTRRAAPGAADPAAVLSAANRCPPPPKRTPPGLPHADDLAKRLGLPDPDGFLELHDFDVGRLLAALEERISEVDDQRLREQLRALLERMQAATERGRAVGLSLLVELLGLLEDPDKHRDRIQQILGELRELPDRPSDLPDLGELVDVIRTDEPDRPCRPVDLDILAEDLGTAIDPRGPDAWPRARVLDTIQGLPDNSTQPVEVCTSVDLPAWRFLRDVAPDWLLPGVGHLTPDRVYAFESNPAFVDAFLLGLNHQALAELRWRNLRITSGCTPLRVFWGRIAPGGGDPLDDVASVGLWSDVSGLGSDQHHPAGADGRNLILVFRTDLFRRYPDTIVSAIAARLDDAGEPDFAAAAAPDGSEARHWPVFQGAIGEDVTFFGFAFTPDEGEGMWFALEEPPPGYRFRSDLTADAPDGAGFARARFNDPTRVLIRGGEIL